MLPNDEDAKRLRDQTFLITEFLAEHAPAFSMPSLRGSALVHGHCHEKAVVDFECERKDSRRCWDRLYRARFRLLWYGRRIRFRAKPLRRVRLRAASACCCLSVRAAAADTLIIANGFSCREQIAQTTNRRAMHIVDVLKRALDEATP